MHRFLIWLQLAGWLAAAGAAEAATGRVIKVLPHFLDLQGRHALSPSLYDRDAYQVHLRQHPEERSGLRFDAQWKTKGGVWEPLKLKLKLELRGFAQGSLPKQMVLERALEARGAFSHWASLTLSGEGYKAFGDVTAWRMSLWEGDRLLGEQKSFLW